MMILTCYIQTVIQTNLDTLGALHKHAKKKKQQNLLNQLWMFLESRKQEV